MHILMTAYAHHMHHLTSSMFMLSTCAQARHVGKSVVRSPTPPAEQYVHGAVMVVGGTGTLGTLMVQWLADKGVRHIPVLSRSGQLPSSIQVLLVSGSSAAHQAAVTIVQCDASFRADAAELQGSCLGGILCYMLAVCSFCATCWRCAL